MNIHDRIALELGRALMRAHAAEAQLADERAKTVDLAKQLADKAKTVPATRRTR